MTGHQTGHERDQLRDQVRDQVSDQVSDQVKRLILTVRGDTKTREEIMELMHLSGRDNFRVTYLTPAIENGYVTLLYPDNPKRKGQAYHLTPKGLDLLAKLK